MDEGESIGSIVRLIVLQTTFLLWQVKLSPKRREMCYNKEIYTKTNDSHSTFMAGAKTLET